MKILFVPVWYPGEFSPLNGDFIFDSAVALREQGIDVAVIYPDVHFRPVLKRLKYLHFPKWITEANGFPEIQMKGIFFPKINKAILDKWCGFYETLYLKYVEKYGEPDLLHAHNFLAGYPALKLSRKYKRPYVITEHKSSLLHEALPGWKAAIARQVYEGASEVIAVSGQLAKAVKGYAKVTPRVIYNMTDTDYFCPDALVKKYEQFTFVAVGSLIYRKGIDMLLEAFKQFLEKHPGSARLEIIGDGPEKEKMQELAKGVLPGGSVCFRGELTRPEVLAAFRSSHAFVHTARQEAFGIVLIEAMATGLPVIATRSGGPEEIVTAETGLLTTLKAEAIAKAMEKVFLETCCYESSVIRAKTIRRFSKAAITAEIIDVYNKL